MRKLAILVSAVASSFCVALAQTPEGPLTSFPYTPGLDVNAMDKSADPCVDFYQYSCGGWKKSNPIPPDQVGWSVYGKLYQDNLNFLRGILEQAALSKAPASSLDQKIGDYYAACMDEAAARRGLRRWQLRRCVLDTSRPRASRCARRQRGRAR